MTNYAATIRSITLHNYSNLKIDETSVYWPYTIILVYTIILISKTGNPTQLFQHHDYSRRESKYADPKLKGFSLEKPVNFESAFWKNFINKQDFLKLRIYSIGLIFKASFVYFVYCVKHTVDFYSPRDMKAYMYILYKRTVYGIKSIGA